MPSAPDNMPRKARSPRSASSTPVLEDAGQAAGGDDQHGIGAAAVALQPSLRGHFEILRVDHWFKNVFVLPGVAVALSLDPARLTAALPLRMALGLLAISLVASSNYVLNEVLDAPYDRLHETKRHRPVPSGRVNIPLAYAQWGALLILGCALGLTVSIPFTLTLVVFWIMGCGYNIPPVRTKDIPYLDVLSEAVNNPLRLLAGWFITGTALIPITSLLLSYWMIGCYFMAMKRFAEYRAFRKVVSWAYLGTRSLAEAAAYRKPFGFYTEARLLISVTFYGATAMLFFGAFLMRYRLELVLSFPLVALVMAIYLAMGLVEDSPVQQPEQLYRQPLFIGAVLACVVVMSTLLFVDIPILHEIFRPTAPINPIEEFFR